MEKENGGCGERPAAPRRQFPDEQIVEKSVGEVQQQVGGDEAGRAKAPEGTVDHVGNNLQRSVIAYKIVGEGQIDMFPRESPGSQVSRHVEMVIPLRDKFMAQGGGKGQQGRQNQQHQRGCVRLPDVFGLSFRCRLFHNK